MNEKIFFKVLKIGLFIFIIFSVVYFWGEKIYNFSKQEDDLAGLPCYENNDIATIEIKGEIVPYFVYTSDSKKVDDPDVYDAVSSEEVTSCISSIQKNDKIKGVIIEISSYGGSPTASEEITSGIKGLNKPTVAVVRSGAASGGYLIATAADKIYASEISDIGGIGVTMSYLDYSQQNKQDGVIYQQLSSGKFKDIGDSDRPLTDEDKDLLMRDVNLTHEVFVKAVATNRNIDIEKVRKLADGSTMLGMAAKENGLIDEIGDSNDAFKWLDGEIATRN